MDDSATLEVSTELKKLRELPKELVQAEFDMCIPHELAPPASFWDPYDSEQKIIGLRACLLLWAATSGRLVPREFQLSLNVLWP